MYVWILIIVVFRAPLMSTNGELGAFPGRLQSRLIMVGGVGGRPPG